MRDEFQKYTGYTKTLQLVTLFLERPGFSFVGVPAEHQFHKNFCATDGCNSCLVSIYNTGALVISGQGGGKLRTALESFRYVVGGKPKGAK
jgi:hypothetical protein